MLVMVWVVRASSTRVARTPSEARAHRRILFLKIFSAVKHADALGLLVSHPLEISQSGPVSCKRQPPDLILPRISEPLSQVP
jgi:hypothetical protein